MQGDGWKRVHGELTRLAVVRAGHDAEEAHWLLEGRRHRVHARLGLGSYVEYLERVFGYPPRLAREKLRVADALADLPLLRAALADGELSWSAVREVSRVAVAETCAEWIAAARGRTVREVEDRVSGRKPGDRPGDPANPAERRHLLRLEITSGTLAAFRDARRRLEDDAGHGLDDDELVRQLAHHVLGGPVDAGRAAYQIAMTVCERCRHASRDGAGRSHPVAAHLAEAAACDAQVLPTHVGRVGRRAAGSEMKARGSVDTPSVQRAEPAESAEVVHVAVPSGRAPAVPTDAQADAPGESTHLGRAVGGATTAEPDARNESTHVGRAVRGVPTAEPDGPGESVRGVSTAEPDGPGESTHVGHAGRVATQTIPPRVRRAVWRRDHGRCQAPGCRAARFLEVHHIVPRARGGSHDPENLTLLCAAHHARVHDGSFVVAGRAPDALAFDWPGDAARTARSAVGPGEPRHARRSPSAEPERPASSSTAAGPGSSSNRQLAADAIGALRRLGVEPAHARSAVADALAERPGDIQGLLRRSLMFLHERVYAARLAGVGLGGSGAR